MCCLFSCFNVNTVHTTPYLFCGDIAWKRANIQRRIISLLCFSVFWKRQRPCALCCDQRQENKDYSSTLYICVMTWWNPFLWDILSTLLTPCTINLIQARSVNPRWLCCVQDNSNEYFHLLRTQEQQEMRKLVLLYYVDACSFCSIGRIQQLRRLC